MTACALTAKHTSIGIYFHDNDITWLFSELLSSLRIKNHVLQGESEIFEADYVITEPKYYNLIRGLDSTRCILVGDHIRIHSESAVLLSQPLTETKILRAIFELVGA